MRNVMKTTLEERKDHSRHVYYNIRDRAAPPEKCFDTSAKTNHIIYLDWFTRRIWEAIYIRAHRLTLKRNGGRYKLPATWTKLIRSHVT